MKTKLDTKHDDFIFPTVNCIKKSSNMPIATVYVINILHSSVSVQYNYFIGQSSADDTKATKTRLRCSVIEVIATTNIQSS